MSLLENITARIESITVIKALNLPKEDSKSKTSIFIKVKVGGQEFTTKTIRSKGDPKWNESFRVEGGKLKDIEFELYEEDQSNQSPSAKKIGIAKVIRYEIRDGKETYLLPICTTSTGHRMSALMSLSRVSQQMSRDGKLSVLKVVIEGNGFTKERVEMVRLLEEEQEERRRMEEELTAEQMAHHKLEEELTAEQMAHHKLEEDLEAEQMAHHKLEEELEAKQELEDDLMKKLKFLLKNVSNVGDDEEKVNDLLRRRQSSFERQIMADMSTVARNEVDEDIEEGLSEDQIENERNLRTDPESISLSMNDEEDDLETNSKASSKDKVPAPAELVSDDLENDSLTEDKSTGDVTVEKEGDQKPIGKEIATKESGVSRCSQDSYEKVLRRKIKEYKKDLEELKREKAEQMRCEIEKELEEMRRTREKADTMYDHKSCKSGYSLYQNGKRIDAEDDGSFLVDVCRGGFYIKKSEYQMKW